jgi:hypothetical protein
MVSLSIRQSKRDPMIDRPNHRLQDTAFLPAV